MTRTEHLLWILAEECAEVAQRASKAARFGLDEVQPGQELSNLQRLIYELNDIAAVADMLTPDWMDEIAIEKKRDKVEIFLNYSQECGTLGHDTANCPERITMEQHSTLG